MGHDIVQDSIWEQDDDSEEDDDNGDTFDMLCTSGGAWILNKLQGSITKQDCGCYLQVVGNLFPVVGMLSMKGLRAYEKTEKI
ncbi:hypothetical protein Tco_0575066 [Tanacetum coccineum]